jgi:nucleoside-diphosphate-sugar epimerase
MQAKSEQIKIRTSYNLSAMNFTPKELALEIQRHIPNFTITYKTDYRQDIADSWPNSIDDSRARDDWGWSPNYTLSKMTKDILKNLLA